MKKALLLICTLAIFAFPTAVYSADNAMQMEIDALVGKWLWAISHEYVDGFANCYWPDATSEIYDSKGISTVWTGVKAIRQRQQEWSDSLDFSTIDLNYPEPTRFFTAAGDMCVYTYVLKQFKEIAIFYFQRRGSEIRIFRQVDVGY